MQELKVIGVEDGALLVASDDGARFRVPVDDVLQSRLRQSSPGMGTGRKLSPREIQSHIRSGMSAEDVSAVTGADLEYVQRFEGPVLAEREYVIESALAVPVHTALDVDPLSSGTTFGTVIRRRLVESGALSERWASWKEEGGEWIVKLTFISDTVDRDARWTFDPKKSTLSPQNAEAVSLSQQGELPASLIPRLRAVAVDEQPDAARFDSGAFASVAVDSASAGSAAAGAASDGAHHLDGLQTGPLLEMVPHGRVGADPDADDVRPVNQTADLLEALRRRRGERDPMDPNHEESMASHPSTGAVRLIDIPLFPDERPMSSAGSPSSGSTGGTGPHGISRGKKGRASMPSWDEIVFGARTDDDL